ncbi:MAG: hypothetical protein PWQ71_705 [Bacteroidota bacterium]|nr:hypothetical protein [Bacteroidota bacterium]
MGSLVTVRTYADSAEADIIRKKLEAENIECFLFENIDPTDNSRKIILQVGSDQPEHSLNILDETQDASERIAIINYSDIGDKKICPFCGSSNIGKMTSGNWLTYIPFLILSLIFPTYRRSYICFDCHRRWMIRKHAVIESIRRHRPKNI